MTRQFTDSPAVRAKRKPQIVSKCGRCGNEYKHKASRSSRFCSRLCHHEAKRTLPKPDPRPCIHCKTVFKPSRKRGDARYCSKRCIMIHQGRGGFSREAIEATRQRNYSLRGTGTKGYVKIDGVHEHRIVAEKMLGRPLTETEIVHHIDGDKHNNDPSNLAVMTQAEHMREHGLGIPGMKLPWKPWESRGKKNANI